MFLQAPGVKLIFIFPCMIANSLTVINSNVSNLLQNSKHKFSLHSHTSNFNQHNITQQTGTLASTFETFKLILNAYFDVLLLSHQQTEHNETVF